MGPMYSGVLYEANSSAILSGSPSSNFNLNLSSREDSAVTPVMVFIIPSLFSGLMYISVFCK